MAASAYTAAQILHCAAVRKTLSGCSTTQCVDVLLECGQRRCVCCTSLSCQSKAPRWQLVHVGSTWQSFGCHSRASPDSRNTWAPASQRHCLRGAARGSELARAWRSLLYPAVFGSDRVERPALYLIFWRHRSAVAGPIGAVCIRQRSGRVSTARGENSNLALLASIVQLESAQPEGLQGEACRIAVLPYAEFVRCAADHK